MKKITTVLMAAAVTMAMLAGCGSSSTKETQAPAGSEAATEAATEAQNALDVQNAKKTKDNNNQKMYERKGYTR